ncbi:sterol desaturase family protein [Duganella radicis]|uniref:Sterol desaturase family protein n=1 Tax=Duganella radicis TaxID=551988 RepID=A0A6L6PQ14_9BURK|nr:sterol desaturase family protein [Duganella radicis]MTV40879.1 sterol desaturase family protein [Duganella radicis]
MPQHLLPNILFNLRWAAFYYAIIAGAFFALWLWWRIRPGKRSPLQAKKIETAQIRRELLTSMGSIVVLGSFMPILFSLGFGRHTQHYERIATHGWPYFFLSILLAMIIQDTYFYWTHRLMHHRRLFRWFHFTHHRSTHTNPWTTYSIHPLEALVDSGSGVLIMMLLPTTGASVLTFSVINTVYAVYTHLGYELFPKGMSRHWLGRWINTSTAHNVHHARARYNFSWYFLFWDRMMGTLSPDYERHYRTAGFRVSQG